MLPKRNIWMTDDLKVEVITWSGRKEDEEDLRALCGEQLQYVRDDGIAAISGSGGFVTEYYAGAGDFIIAEANSTRPVLKLPGDHWLVQELFGSKAPQAEAEAEAETAKEQPSA